MKLTKKTLALLLALAMCISLFTFGAAAADPSAGDIVIIYTNDVHNVTASTDAATSGAPKLDAYAQVAAYVKEMKAIVGNSNVTLVDAGDFAQGEAIGTLTKGGYPVEIMNEIGYDIVVPGNHEFDYGMERMQELMGMLDAKVISANFTDLGTGEAVYDAYTIVEYGSVKVAYVGMTTPESFTKSTPVYFQNDAGEWVYGFCEGGNGQELYDVVQSAVDAAIAEGADYVIAVGHLGVDEVSAPWRSIDVIANTTGIDAFIDGHSHSAIAGDNYKNKAGEDVLLTQTGSKLANIGCMVIAADGSITSTLISTSEYENFDADALAYLEGISALFAEELGGVVAKSDYDLVVNDPATGSRMIRSRETNLGDLCADAYRFVLGADIAFVNGGGIRTNIKAGDITYGNVIAVHPFGNVGCVVEATGQQIIDALEMSSRAVPGELGGFLQVSGIEYTIDWSIASTVVVDDKGMFEEVAGARRVSDVKVGGVDIELDKTYSLASHDYMLLNKGDGINMFSDNKILVQPVILDNQVLIDYINDYLDGVVGEAYADPYGQGRITTLNNPDDWAAERVAAAVEAGLVPQSVIDGGWKRPTTRLAAAETMVNLIEAIFDKTMDEFAEEEGWDLTDGQFEDTDSPQVTFLRYAGVVHGVDGVNYEPNGRFNRAMVVTIIGQAIEVFAQIEVKGDNPFVDEIPDYAIPYVGFAAEMGIVEGDGDGQFSSFREISNQEIAILSLQVFTAIQAMLSVSA